MCKKEWVFFKNGEILKENDLIKLKEDSISKEIIVNEELKIINGNIFYRKVEIPNYNKLIMKNGSYNKKTKKSLDSLIDVAELNGHKICSPYFNSEDKMLFEYGCGHPPELRRPSDYKSGHIKCKKCNGCCPEQAKERLIELIEINGHILLSEYKNDNSKIFIDFNCGHPVHEIRVNDYKNGYGCPQCGGRCSKSAKEEFFKLIKQNGDMAIGDYIRDDAKVEIIFNCSHNGFITPNHYKRGVGCGTCKNKGEKFIIEWLTKNNIEFVKQYRLETNIDDMKRRRYDFYIPQNNSVIELMGKQHYEFIPHFHKTIEGFYEQQRVDRMKKDFAIEKGFDYIEIDYSDAIPKNAVKKLSKYLKTYIMYT